MPFPLDKRIFIPTYSFGLSQGIKKEYIFLKGLFLKDIDKNLMD
jgi:hypothetical protein